MGGLCVGKTIVVIVAILLLLLFLGWLTMEEALSHLIGKTPHDYCNACKKYNLIV